MNISIRCPCEISPEPCHPKCGCVKPGTMKGCLCCCRTGDESQRLMDAARIINACQTAPILADQRRMLLEAAEYALLAMTEASEIESDCKGAVALLRDAVEMAK